MVSTVMARIYGANAIANILESIWGYPVTDWAVYHMIRDPLRPLPVESLRRPGKTRGKLSAAQSDLEAFARSYSGVSTPSEPLAVNKPKSVVYFIVAGEHVKIGITTLDIRRRLATIRAANPIARLVATTPGGLKEERGYHARFAEHRVHGEWFKNCESISREIENLKRGQHP